VSDAGATQRRVLEVLFSFRVGGSEVVGIELAKHLADKGTEVLCTAIDGMDGPLRSRCAEYGLEVIVARFTRLVVRSRLVFDVPPNAKAFIENVDMLLLPWSVNETGAMPVKSVSLAYSQMSLAEPVLFVSV